MSIESKKTIKNVAFELGTLISLLTVGMGAAYGYGMLNNRVVELETKCQGIMVMREDIAAMKVMMANVLEIVKEKH